MATSRKGLIQQSLVDRIKTVTAANGYDTDIQKVFSDEIPMGLDLDEFELPAVLVISGKDTFDWQTQWIKGNWIIELQLIHLHSVGDSIMHNFVRDVVKSISANSPTLVKGDAWRIFDGKPTSVKPIETDTDLNMIDGNRFYSITYMVQYHTHPTDL